APGCLSSSQESQSRRNAQERQVRSRSRPWRRPAGLMTIEPEHCLRPSSSSLERPAQMRLPLLLLFLLQPLGHIVVAEELVVASGAKPGLLQEEGAGEGPAWHPELGLLTSGDGHTYRRDRGGKLGIYRKNTGSNGLLFDRQGRLVMCEAEARRITRLGK